MSKIFIKFRAAKDFDTVLFDGVSMSAFDLKREIMISKRLGPGNNIDLKIYDAQTEEEFSQDHDQIPRNASIIVRKVPAADFRNASRYLEAANAPVGSMGSRGNMASAVPEISQPNHYDHIALLNHPTHNHH